MREAIRDEGGNQRSSAEVIRGQALHTLALLHLFSASCAAWLALNWLSNMRFIDAILSFSDSRSCRWRCSSAAAAPVASSASALAVSARKACTCGEGGGAPW